MNISCVLGLVVCLNYQGTNIPDEDVFVMRVYCDEISSFPASSFLMNSRYHEGYSWADELEKLGLKFKWKPKGRPSQGQLENFRKAELNRACREFIAIASSPRNWKK